PHPGRSRRGRTGPDVLFSSSARLRARGEVAQLVEHTAENRGVAGSSPALAISATAARVRVTPVQPTSFAILGAGLDLGAGRRGVDMGPSAIRYAGLFDRIRSLGLEVADLGDVGVAVPEAVEAGDEQARFLPEILRTCEHVADLVSECAAAGRLPLVLGGDHSVALGTLEGMARERGAGGVLWVDAHADMNTPETSPSGNVHGMPLAAALGLAGPLFERPGWPSPAVERAVLVGVRSVDSGERDLIRSAGVKAFTMADVDKMGVEHVMRESLAYLDGSRFVHL